MNKYKTILFTHDDLDGAGCRIVFDLVHGKLDKGTDYNVLNCTNGNVNDVVMQTLESGRIDENTVVWFGDICASREVLQEIQKYTKNLWVVDHHRTNFFCEHELPDSKQAIIVPENDLGIMQSGTSLMFQLFNRLLAEDAYPYIDRGALTGGDGDHREYVARFVDTVRSYDTYEWKQTGNQAAKELCTLFFMLGMERFCIMYLKNLRDPFYSKKDLLDSYTIRQFVDYKLEQEEDIIKNFGVDRIVQIDVRGLRTALLIGSCYPANMSELANRFLTEHPEFDMFAQFTLTEGGVFGFRAIRDDLDTGRDIALPIGGGGHPKASGAPCDGDFKYSLTWILEHYLNGDIITDVQFAKRNPAG